MVLPMKKAPMKAAMKKVKGKRVTKIAKGKYAKSVVLRGSKEKTSGGLKKEALMKNKRGKVVSKKASSTRAKLYRGSKLEKWVKAVQAARKALGVTGFLALNGGSAQGKALYAKAKAFYTA